jgi:DNA helicase-2/ATP-dependent DNA helicase PcrA
VSHAANRRVHNLWQTSIPSRFIAELPPASVEFVAEPGLASGAGYARFGFADEPWQARPQRMPARAGAFGWRHRPSAPLVDPGERVFGSESAKPSYAAGMRVFHQKFGYGTIQSVTGDKLEIAFEHAGLKKVIDSFVAKA